MDEVEVCRAHSKHIWKRMFSCSSNQTNHWNVTTNCLALSFIPWYFALKPFNLLSSTCRTENTPVMCKIMRIYFGTKNGWNAIWLKTESKNRIMCGNVFSSTLAFGDVCLVLVSFCCLWFWLLHSLPVSLYSSTRLLYIVRFYAFIAGMRLVCLYVCWFAHIRWKYLQAKRGLK